MSGDPSGIDPNVVERINDSTASASGLPNRAYTSVEFFELERERLFATTWTCLGHACRVRNAGDILPVSLLGIPLIMLRNAPGEIRVFHNVCSHRGNELVWEACHVKGLIRCPYHSWTYDLDGELRGTPHVGGPGNHEVEGFDKGANGLHPVRTAVWMDLVFVNLAETAPPFEEHIAPLVKRLSRFGTAADFTRLRPAATHGRLELELEANWKLCLENNLESYHLPWVHPDLNSYSRLEDHYHFYGGDLYAGQGSNVYDLNRGSNTGFPLFPEWPDKVAEYPTLFPNVFVGVQRDHLWSMVINPVAHDRTVEQLQIYYLDEGADSDLYESSRKGQLEAWTKVFSEDVGVVEGMQRGRRSPAFAGGVLTPVMDKPTRHFSKWVANTLTGG